MSKFFIEQYWDIRHIRNGKVIYEELDKQNIVVDSGEKAILDVFYRKKDILYFAGDYFYIGLYNGSISESTILTNVPNEPSGNGYVRTQVERSDVGWPTIEKHEGDWRVVSKEIELTASGGNIGPVSGAFVCTSLDSSGVLIGAVAMAVERTVKPGDKIIFQVRAKQK